MFVSHALSRLHTEVEDLHDVIPLTFLQHLSTAHIYHNYRHLVHSLYKHKAKQQVQVVTNPKIGHHPKTTNTISSNSVKVAKTAKQSRMNK